MKEFYKVRVVEGKLKNSYEVQVKSKWYSYWRCERSFDTYDGEYSETVKRVAIECADRLAESRVIYEVK